MPNDAVIYKQVYLLDPEKIDQTFEVPLDARLIAIDWDTRVYLGIAFWYTFRVPEDTKKPTKPYGEMVAVPMSLTWRITIRGTGASYPYGMTHLGTVVRDHYAWHLLDMDGNNIRWANR